MNECYYKKTLEIACVRAGYPARGSIKPDSSSEIAIVQIRDFNEDRTSLDVSNLTHFNPGRAISKELTLLKDDILFLAKGAKNFAYAMPELPSITVASGYFLTLRLTSDKALPAYVAWYLRQDAAIGEMRRLSGSGVHMPVVRRSTLENLVIPLPPLAIQKTIIQLDDLMWQEQALLCELTQKRKQLITAAILPSINNKRIPL